MMKIRIETISDNAALNLAIDTIKNGKQAIVFANTKRSAEKAAEDISHKIKTQDEKLERLSEECLHALSKPTKQSE